MAAQVKKFAEHSARWQRDARRKGIDPKRWDKWRTLSPKSRRQTNPYTYSKGQRVTEIVRSQLLDAATTKVVAVHNNQRNVQVRRLAVRRNLSHPDAQMSNNRLRRLVNMTPQKLQREIDDSLSRNYSSGERSPFWYEKRG